MKYICEYQIPGANSEERYFALSACDKAKYVHSVLNRLGYDVEIVSPSYAKRCSRSRVDKVSEHVILYSGFSLGWNDNVTKVISRASAMLWLLYFLLFKCKRKETIMIYHGVQNIPIYIIAKKIKRFKYILEVEELYSSLSLSSVSCRLWLEKTMIRLADSFIFASQQLECKCNVYNKPFVIDTGSYFVPDVKSEKINDGRIHLVYAGLIEKDKVAFKSANLARFLDARYVIHIIGYGNDADINALEMLINELNLECKCLVSYDGLKRGDDYESFLQSCHIGICPLLKNIDYQMACFPSKITSYLSNGLLVVTTENEVLRTSVYMEYLYFVKDDSPESFAHTVTHIDVTKGQDARICIKNEDERVLQELPLVLSI